MIQTTITTQVSMNENKEISPTKKVNPEEKNQKKTLHEKLFGDIHELEVKRDSKFTHHHLSEFFSSLNESPMLESEKDLEK
jgi:hypothetical protein